MYAFLFFQPMDIGSLFNFFGLAAMAAVVALAGVLILKLDQIKELKKANEKLKKSLNDMDEQAKLIVRTDLELNKTQEELDKKIDSLYTLQKISQGLSTTLEEEQIFLRIEDAYLEELGFEKFLIVLLDKEKRLLVKRKFGFSSAQIHELETKLTAQVLGALVQEKNPVFSLQPNEKYKSIYTIMSGLNINSFIIAPIPVKEGPGGLIIIANESAENILTEGNQEVAAILGAQIGQALENARLFEETWRSHQELEKRVRERTEELSRALEEIKLSSKRKTEFVSAVSHELRTPLTSIKGYASILAAEQLGSVPLAVKERLEKINRHSDELTQFINNLLDISRLESGRMEMKLEPQKLAHLVETVTDMLSLQIKEKAIKLTTDLPKNLPEVLADHSQIERVLINLIGNAIKFTPQKGEIKIIAKDANGYIQVDISDSGIGIPEKDLQRIFEEFYRVDNPINQQLRGTGLGLSLVKSILEAHKGKIWAESKPNKGSIFSFTLPKARG